MAYVAADFIREWNGAEPYVKACTSGSTGSPKEIRLLKSDMTASAEATNSFFGIGCDSVLGLPLSCSYIAGKMMAVRALTARCRLVELPVSNDILLNEHFDLLSVVPSQLGSLLKDAALIHKVGNLLIGGAPLSPGQEKAVAASGVRAWLGYGMTETCSHVALRRVGGDGVFHAMPGIRFSADVRGCLVIESDRFSWKKLVTNDVAELLTPRSFRWIGRADNVVNSGGVKLNPEQLEMLYREAVPELPPFYLVGEPDEVLGQRLVMVAEKGFSGYDVLRNKIADHKLLPRRIAEVDMLPATPGGKIARIIPDTKK